MKKNVYSLILSERLVGELDAWAAQKALSRSKAMDSILAQFFYIQTPEQSINKIISDIEMGLEKHTRLLLRRSNDMMVIRIPLKFKYNPFVRCVVQLFADGCEIRLSVRTQNQELINIMNKFYRNFCGQMQLSPEQVDIVSERLWLKLPIEDFAHSDVSEELLDFIMSLSHSLDGFFKNQS